MSTRSCIAKPDGDGWRGRYHHSDGYPTGVGAFLIRAYNGYFAQDLDAMIAYLVDGEKVGWSFVIDTDLSVGPQWLEYGDYPKDDKGWADYSKIGPQSYTARGETPFHDTDGTGDWITNASTDRSDIEWTYVLTPGGVMVADGTSAPSNFVPWNVPDPKAAMDEIEKAVYASYDA